MKIATLLENTALSAEFGAEHGLSLYIEAAGHRILFDMGQTDLFAKNADRLGIDLADVDIAVLSHGHYDHSGGLAHFLRINSAARVYANRDAFAPHCSGDRYIGVDPAIVASDRIIRTGDHMQICEGIALRTCNARLRKYGSQAAGMRAFVDGQMIDDDFRHEQYMLIEDGDRRIAISGCSHKGICNIAEWMRADVLIGGFHLKGVDASDPAIAETARTISKHNTKFYTCHCTGMHQYRALKAIMGEQIDYLCCGQVIEV